MKALKKRVQDHVEQQSLNSEQLDSLLSLQATVNTADRNSIWRSSALSALAIAASLLILIITFFPHTSDKPEDRIQAIALEVVKNHLHQKPLEINSPQLAVVSPYFERLDFRPIESQYLQSRQFDLMGGRYCSLQGIPAAQLRYINNNNQTQHTLYQVPYRPEAFDIIPDISHGQAPLHTFANGVRVSLWVENGILFALTGE